MSTSRRIAGCCLSVARFALSPLGLQAQAGHFALHERQVQTGGGEYEADIAHVLVLAAFAREFELTQATDPVTQ